MQPSQFSPNGRVTVYEESAPYMRECLHSGITARVVGSDDNVLHCKVLAEDQFGYAVQGGVTFWVYGMITRFIYPS